MSAVARALHLFAYGPRALLLDWVAWPLGGADAERIAAATPAVIARVRDPFMTWFAARSRIAEDWLTTVGAKQYVILGAGLDSFAWRRSADVRVFEVDRAATQEWKAQRVKALGLLVPQELVSLPLDFEDRSLGRALEVAGVASSGVLVSWLGVVPYLKLDTIRATLGSLPPCSLAVAYVPPSETWDDSAKPTGHYFLEQVRELGEPWISLLPPDEMAALLDEAGFTVVHDLGASDVEDRYGLPAIHHERIILARKD
jgi:methyltransferase (TIGR00027 family)